MDRTTCSIQASRGTTMSMTRGRYVTSTTNSGLTQCTFDSLSGDPNRLSRGEGNLGHARGFSAPARRFNSLSVMPVPARPAYGNRPSSVQMAAA